MEVRLKNCSNLADDGRAEQQQVTSLVKRKQKLHYRYAHDVRHIDLIKSKILHPPDSYGHDFSLIKRNRLDDTQWSRRKKEMEFWLEVVNQRYPNLERRTYFIPALHFNRINYSIAHVHGATVRVIKPVTQLSDVRGSEAHQRAIYTLRCLFGGLCEPMVVISNLDFDNYLNNPRSVKSSHLTNRPEKKNALSKGNWRDSEESSSAANSLFLRPRDLEREYQRGTFDILIISKKFGFVICEIKTIGDMSDENSLVCKKVMKSLVQLDKEEVVLRHLTSDLLGMWPIRKALILPNLKKKTLTDVLQHSPNLRQELARCFKTSDCNLALKCCIFSEQLPSVGRAWEVSDDVLKALYGDWWQNLAKPSEQPMMDEVYFSLVSRFCGPATSQTVQTGAQRRVEVNTLQEAVLETAHCMQTDTLYPFEVELLKRKDKHLFLSGPPGTGKTLLLVLKALEWLHQGHEVYVLSLWDGSEAVALHIKQWIEKYDPPEKNKVRILRSKLSDFSDVLQKLETSAFSIHNCKTSETGLPNGNGLQRREETLNELESFPRRNARYKARPRLTTEDDLQKLNNGNCSSQTKDIKIIVDEAPWFLSTFVRVLEQRVKSFSLWAASSFAGFRPRPGYFAEVTLNQSLRCPPVVVRELELGFAYSWRNMARYRSLDPGGLSSAPPVTDGPPIVKISHSGHAGKEKDDVWECKDCGLEVAKFLTGDLQIGCKLGHQEEEKERLKFKDVIISGHVTLTPKTKELALTSNSEDDATWKEMMVHEDSEQKKRTLKPEVVLPGFLQGLQKGGIAFDLILNTMEDVKRLVSPVEDDLVFVVEPVRILGLERPVVVCVGTKDIRAKYPRYVDPWFDVIACCTSQLIIVD